MCSPAICRSCGKVTYSGCGRHVDQVFATFDHTPVASASIAQVHFATLRLRLLKLGARIIETVSRVRLAFSAACPQAELFRTIAIALQPAEP